MTEQKAVSDSLGTLRPKQFSPGSMQKKPISVSPKPSSRRTLSCYPCRRHKIKCDRHVPCHMCIRYERQDECRRHPATQSLLMSSATQTPARLAPGLADKKQRSDLVGTIHGSPERCLVSQITDKNEIFLTSDHQCMVHNLPPLHVLPIGNNQPSSLATVLRQPLDSKLFWKIQLVAMVPSQSRCDKLVSFYIENIEWIYHAIHIPSFRRQYAAFWSTSAADVDLIWLSLLLTIISAAALLVPIHSAKEITGVEKSKARDFAHVWYQACRQALHAGDFESKPSLMALQVFLVTQLYWLETKNFEILNSALGQAVRNSQALGLDKNIPGTNYLETEMRRRVWWELVICDVYQALCLDRAPLIHTSSSEVPRVVHCNDADVTETSVIPRPMSEPTDMSTNIARYEVYTVLRKVFHDNGSRMSSYEYVRSIDDEIEQIVFKFPWYFRINSEECLNHLPSLNDIAWQYEVLHIGICLQRIRLNRPFLYARIGESWTICAKAAQQMLIPYRIMRESDVEAFRNSPKFLMQGYQAYTAAVALAAFLLVEKSLPGFPSDSMKADIEMVISDLEVTDLSPTLIDGVQVLRKMLVLFDQGNSRDPQARELLVQEIASVFGGEHLTRKYLKRSNGGFTAETDSMNLPEIETMTRRQPTEMNNSISVGARPFLEGDIPNALWQSNDPMAMDFSVALEMLRFDECLDFFPP